MKKYIIAISIILLAAACSKSQPVVQNSPTQNQPPSSASSTTPVAISTPATSPKATTKPVPVTLSVYNAAAEHYKILYLSYFKLFTGAQVKANNIKGVNFSACAPYGLSPDLCFVLNNQPYANTNLESAAVAVKVLKNITNIGDCGTFTSQQLEGGKNTAPFQDNGVVFITAETSDAGAGSFSETHFNRTFYGTICYEIDETARWANASNFSPPRAEFDKADVWNKLDVLRNGFQFVK